MRGQLLVAFDFNALPEEAKRAAFAHMDAQRKAARAATDGSGRSDPSSAPEKPQAKGTKGLGSGNRHKDLKKTGAQGSPEKPPPTSPTGAHRLGSGTRAKKLANEPSRGSRDNATARDPAGKANALAEAYRSGHTVLGDIANTEEGNSEELLKVRLSDGTEAVYKKLVNFQSPSEAEDAYLAGLTAGALGIEHTATAKLSKNEIIQELAPGVQARDHLEQVEKRAEQALPDTPMNPVARIEARATARQAAKDHEAQRILGMRNSREIALMDYLTGQGERHTRNYLVDGDTVQPVDQKYAGFTPLAGDNDHQVVLRSPFSQHHLRANPGRVDIDEPLPDPVPLSELTSPFSTKEMARFRSRLEALEPAFAAEGATRKWRFMMQRFATLEGKG